MRLASESGISQPAGWMSYPGWNTLATCSLRIWKAKLVWLCQSRHNPECSFISSRTSISICEQTSSSRGRVSNLARRTRLRRRPLPLLHSVLFEHFSYCLWSSSIIFAMTMTRVKSCPRLLPYRHYHHTNTSNQVPHIVKYLIPHYFPCLWIRLCLGLPLVLLLLWLLLAATPCREVLDPTSHQHHHRHF